MKIIQILHHSLTNYIDNIDPKFYENDWHVKVAKNIKKRTNKYDIECWRPEISFNKTYTRIGNDGIKYKIFPSKALNLFNQQFEYSSPLIKELKKEILKNEILIHLHGFYNLNSYSILKKIGEKCPIVAQSHGGKPAILIYKESSHRLKKLLLFEHLLQKITMPKIDYLFCLNPKEQEELLKYSNGKIQPMGVDFNKFKPIKKETCLKKTGLNEEHYILYVGRLTTQKGIESLINAFENIKSYKLLMIGEGPNKNNLKLLADKLNISKNIKFLGQVSNDDLPYYYNIADITIFPSLGEAYPVVPIESLACKTPIITTNVGAINQITGHFRGGYGIVPKNNPDAIINAFNEFISGKIDKSFIDRENGSKYYDWNSIINSTLSIYNKLYEEYYG